VAVTASRHSKLSAGVLSEKGKDVFSRFLKRVRLLASLNRLFVKIVLWFWATIWAVLLIIVATHYLSGIREVNQPNLNATVAPILAAEAIHAYETGGPQGFARFSRSNVDDERRRLFLLDGSYHDVLKRHITVDGLRVARATKSGRLTLLRNHIAGYRAVSASGHEYVFLLYISAGFLGAREQIFASPALLLFLLAVVTLLCVWLAWHIIAPVYAIQAAARRVTLGDLHARVPDTVLHRHDELAALGKDFNSMVQRIEILVTSHKSLLAAVSHELRSPLTRLNICVAMLHKSVIDDRGEELLERMDRDVTAIDALMGQLLTLSRFEAGISGGRREDVDLSLLVHQVCADAGFEADALGKEVAIAVADGVILAGADPHALRSAFENIIRNAVRFTGIGSVVDVDLSTGERGDSACALLSVRDRGPGVPEELLESIFKPFFRAPNSQDVPGNGLGLAIAAEAVRLHQGTVVAMNGARGGLEVLVELPLPAHDRKPEVPTGVEGTVVQAI
jgi:two-component system sensor histidine kinase CpxA